MKIKETILVDIAQKIISTEMSMDNFKSSQASLMEIFLNDESMDCNGNNEMNLQLKRSLMYQFICSRVYSYNINSVSQGVKTLLVLKCQSIEEVLIYLLLLKYYADKDNVKDINMKLFSKYIKAWYTDQSIQELWKFQKGYVHNIEIENLLYEWYLWNCIKLPDFAVNN